MKEVKKFYEGGLKIFMKEVKNYLLRRSKIIYEGGQKIFIKEVKTENG